MPTRCSPRLGTALALLALAAPAPAQASEEAPEGDGPARPLTAAQALADLDLLERTLVALHPGYGRYTPVAELAAGFESARARVADGATDAALLLEVSRLLEAIRCDHTKAEAPERLRRWRETHPTHLPVAVKILDGRLFVRASAVDGIARGDELVAVDGKRAAEVRAEVEALISIDGWTEHARAAEAEESSEYLGSGLDHFLPLLHGFRERFTLTVRADLGRGEERILTAPGLTLGRWLELAARDAEPVEDFRDAVHLDLVGSDTALLRVDTFVNYRRPVDPMQKLGAVFREIAAAGVEHLVVDLRANGGGSVDASEALVAHLVREPLTTGEAPLVRCTRVPDELRAHLTTWDDGAFDPPAELFEPAQAGLHRMKVPPSAVAPAPDAFRGERVTLLSSRANASGTTLLLSALAGLEHVRVVGERTGGSVEGPTAGTLFFLTLPASGIVVRVPAIRSVTGRSAEPPDTGLAPDVVAELTPEAWLADEDPALEAALDGR